MIYLIPIKVKSFVKILVYCGAGNASQTLIFILDRKVARWLSERIITKTSAMRSNSIMIMMIRFLIIQPELCCRENVYKYFLTVCVLMSNGNMMIVFIPECRIMTMFFNELAQIIIILHFAEKFEHSSSEEDTWSGVS